MFGKENGLSFSTVSAAPFTGGQSLASEAASAISHPLTGDLLFYASGEDVWSANHTLQSMPGHWNPVGTR